MDFQSTRVLLQRMEQKKCEKKSNRSIFWSKVSAIFRYSRCIFVKQTKKAVSVGETALNMRNF